MTMLHEYCTISDAESVSFVERKTWSKLGDAEAEAMLLKNCTIVDSLITISGIYFILEDRCPNMSGDLTNPLYKIAKITTNEETGKIELHSMEVTKNQANQFVECGPWMISTGPDLPEGRCDNENSS